MICIVPLLYIVTSRVTLIYSSGRGWKENKSWPRCFTSIVMLVGRRITEREYKYKYVVLSDFSTQHITAV